MCRHCPCLLLFITPSIILILFSAMWSSPKLTLTSCFLLSARSISRTPGIDQGPSTLFPVLVVACSSALPISDGDRGTAMRVPSLSWKGLKTPSEHLTSLPLSRKCKSNGQLPKCSNSPQCEVAVGVYLHWLYLFRRSIDLLIGTLFRQTKHLP